MLALNTQLLNFQHSNTPCHAITAPYVITTPIDTTTPPRYTRPMTPTTTTPTSLPRIDLSGIPLYPPAPITENTSPLDNSPSLNTTLHPTDGDPSLDPTTSQPEFLPLEEDGTPSRSLKGLANKILRDQAKSLFLHSQQSLTSICETLDVPLHELKTYVYGKLSQQDDWQRNPKCWAYQRNYSPELSVARYERIEPILVKSSMKSTIQVMIRNLQRLEAADETLEVRDIKGLMDIYGQLDKIRRLTDGLATENLGIDRSTWTMREITEDRRKSNPFVDAHATELDRSPDIPELVEDVEYKTMEVSR